MAFRGCEIDDEDGIIPNMGLAASHRIKCADSTCWQKDKCKRYMLRRMSPDLTVAHADSLRRKWQAPSANCINFQEKS